MTSEQAVTTAIHRYRLTERFYEAIEQVGTGRKWRTPMKLLTDERNTK